MKTNLQLEYMKNILKKEATYFFTLKNEKRKLYINTITKEIETAINKEFKDNTVLAREVSKYLKKYNINQKEFVAGLLAYTNQHVDANAKNEEYRDDMIRIAMHFHYFWQGSYHRARGLAVKKWINKCKPKTIIDVGYSSPSDYMLDKNIMSKTKLTLSDFDNSAHNFSKIVFKEHGINQKNIKFITKDMNHYKYVGNFDTYVFLDSIEHSLDPDRYLKKQTENAKPGAKFIFSIPIMPLYSLRHAHFKEWLDEKAAEKWLKESGLTIIDKELAVPNIFIDKFAIYMKGGYYSALYLCKK